MSNKPSIDPSELTSGFESLMWAADKTRQSDKYDAYGPQTVFSIRVLTRPTTLSGEEYQAVMGDSSTANSAPEKKYSRVMFKGRITSAGGTPSPHLSLPDPCYLTAGNSPEDTQCAARIISMHTTFFSNMDPKDVPSIGDLVRGRLEPGDLGKFNLQYATFTEVESKTGIGTMIPPTGASANAAACRANLIGLFEIAARHAPSSNLPADRLNSPGQHVWKDRKLQRIIEWSSTKYTSIPNGTKIYNGDKDMSPPGTYTDIGGADLISAAIPDWERLKAAYKKKFKTLTLTTRSAYRSYEGQVTQRLLRHDGNDVYRGGCTSKSGTATGGLGSATTHKCTPAAKPGTSNHGFGASVDIQTTASGFDPPSTPTSGNKLQKNASEQFRWLNQYAKDYNFLFAVKWENWHLDWIPFSDQVKAIQGSKPRPPTNPWSGMLPNKPAVTKV